MAKTFIKHVLSITIRRFYKRVWFRKHTCPATYKLKQKTTETSLKTRSHDPFLRIRFLLVSRIEWCEHIENDRPTHGSVSLKKRMEIEHALFSSDTLLER